MGIIRTTYNFIMGLIGLLVIGLIVFVFFLSEWQEYQDRQYAEERAEVTSAVVEAARERGLGDLEQLRQDYLARCPVGEFRVFEGDAMAICSATADVLLARSRQREMTLLDQAELGYQLCALDAEEEGADPDDYCDRQEVIDETLADAVALALCEFDRAWLFDPYSEESLTKRGPAVYAYHERRVDCKTRLFSDWYYEGFFDVAPEEDEDWPSVLEQLYDALESDKPSDALAVLDAHEFGNNEQVDQWVLNPFLDDRFVTLLPEVLERNGGQVNFATDYYSQPLSQAVEQESPKTALALLEAGADPVRPYHYGVAPVVNAAGAGMLDVVKALVARGADVNGVVGSESLDFGAPLRRAAWNSHEETALWLLQSGAKIAPQDPAQFPLWSGGSLLDHAVVGGDLAVVDALVQMGAASEDLDDLILGAVAGANPDVLLLLFEQGYKLPAAEYHDRLYDKVVSVIQEEGNGRVEHGVRMFEVLLERGLNMSELSDSGWNYGHQAVIHYAPPTIRKADAGERDNFVYAQRTSFVKRVIDEVLAAGIDIDQRYETETMLMKAADGGKVELVRYLLGKGADATLKNDAGLSALDIGVQTGRRMISFWDEDEELRRRYSELVEVLGGDRELLSSTEDQSPTI